MTIGGCRRPARWAAVAAGIAAASCHGERPAPSPRPLPAVDALPSRHRVEPESPRIANYRIDARYDAVAHTIDGRMDLTWRNAGASPVDRLPFHLYMNAFAARDTVFMRESHGAHRDARADWSHPGWIEVDAIAIDGGDDVRDRAVFPAEDRTVLEVPLAAAIPPGGAVTVAMSFRVQLPRAVARTGFEGDFAMVGQWFPKIGVRTGPPGDERWHCEPFHANSEFFADFGVYDVSLRVPATHVVAASGVLLDAVDHGDGTRTLRYRAEDVHDFAWAIDPYFEFVEGTVTTERGPVRVRVYHRPDQRAFAQRHLRAAIGAIDAYSALFVPYPWTTMTVVDPPPAAADATGGMEYPTLVTTAGDGPAADLGLVPEFVTVHEVGHNWFQGILASNEVDEAWLDEGVNQYTNGLAIERIYGSRPAIDAFGVRLNYRQLTWLQAGWFPAPIAQPSYRYPLASWYGDATYVRTALALQTLERVLGRDRVVAALADYAREWAFRHPTGDDLFAALERHAGPDHAAFVREFVDAAFRRGGAADLRVEHFACERDTCDVVVANRGDVAVPCSISIEFADGTSSRVDDWDGRSTLDLHIDRGDAVRVDVDPDGRVALDRSGPARSKTRGADRAAARAAGARAQFWTQTVLGVVGL